MLLAVSRALSLRQEIVVKSKVDNSDDPDRLQQQQVDGVLEVLRGNIKSVMTSKMFPYSLDEVTVKSLLLRNFGRKY